MSHSLPLKGIQILDFSRLVPGPFCTKILSDFGATVIKIEDLFKGDYLSQWGSRIGNKESLLDVYFNKNKKRLALDCFSAEGLKVIYDLVKKSDVFIESSRPGILAKKGLGSPKLHQINSKLIYVSLTGYGKDKKRSQKAGHDINFMATSGILSHFIPEPSQVSSKKAELSMPKYPLADFVGGGLFSAMMIMVQLTNPDRKNIKCDVSMVEALAYLNHHNLFYKEARDLSMIEGDLARYRLYITKDNQWVALGALEDKFWSQFCDVVSLPRLKGIGFNLNKNKKAILILKKLFQSKTRRYWEKFSMKHDVCLSVLSHKQDLVQEGYLSPQALSLGKREIKTHELNSLKSQKKQYYHTKGQDTVAILKGLGYSSQKIKHLIQKGVLKTG